MADFWKIVEVNTGICVPKYLKNVLMLYGYDDASSIESINMEDIDSIEEFVKSGIDEQVGDGEAKDVYHRFPHRKYQFIVTKGDRMKLMNVVEFVRNKMASEGGHKFFYQSDEIIQQTLGPTSSKSLHSQQLFVENDNNQPIKTERNLRDRQLLVRSTSGVQENSHDRAILADSPTKQNRITSFSSEDRSDDVKDENLRDPLRFRTPSPSHMKIFSRHENVKIGQENDTRDNVDFTKDCENKTKMTSHLSKENHIVVLLPKLKHCQVKIAKLNFDNYLLQIGNFSRLNKTALAHEVKKGLQIALAADVVRESSKGDEKLKDENPAIQIFSCDICGKIFKSKGRIMQHMKFHTGEGPYVCDVCSKAFSHSTSLLVHKKIHTGIRFACDVCPKTFNQASTLSVHKRIHTGNRFACNVCPKTFNQPSSLWVHKRIHSGNRFACNICPKTFNQPSTLWVHKRIHSGEKPFVCDVCSKTFNQSSNLLVHKRIHTGESFACDVCPKVFRSSSHLSEHKRIHTGEKPFVCEVCGKVFIQSSNLSVHKKIHTGERFPCDVCPKVFRSSSNLSEHKKIHTGGRFACDFCPKTFGQSAHLFVHRRIHTGEKRCLP